MKVEQLNNVQIDWTKPQVVVSANGNRFFLVTNQIPENEERFCAVCMQTGSFSNSYKKDSFKPETATQYPIDLKMTIESEIELCNLLHRIGLMVVEVNNNTELKLTHCADGSDLELNSLLHKLAIERNLYKND